MWWVIVLIGIGLLLGPGWWVRHVLRRYATPTDRYAAAGTGASGR